MRQLTDQFPVDLPEWQSLAAHYKAVHQRLDLQKMFQRDPRRADRFSIQAGDLFVDYSKNLISPTTQKLLLQFANAAGVTEQRAAMFTGEHINVTEDRAVLHVALRAAKSDRFRDGSQNCTRDVWAVREAMRKFVTGVHRGRIAGVRGRRFTDVVNIGIGGSDLGIAMATRALEHTRGRRPRVHCVSNVDGTQLADLTRSLNPATTLFVICSKTFTTQETMENAKAARRWVKKRLGEKAVAKHFAAASTNHSGMDKFGINPEYRFGFWDWVGGRYSLWSAVGLSIALGIGWPNFEQLLAGARKQDQHFLKAPMAENAPVVLALLAVWYRAFFLATSHVVLPYDNRLDRLPAFLQQLQMESNGKSVKVNGQRSLIPTGAVVWGEAGNNAQHSFYQLLHQGTDIVPADFVASLKHSGGGARQHRLALANCFAQSRALMTGQTAAEIRTVEKASGKASVIAHRVHDGNRPTTTILLPKTDAHSLGQLIALYEHKTFVEGVLLGINSFDQWGVQLGKAVAKTLEKALGSCQTCLDSSTNQLIKRFKDAD